MPAFLKSVRTQHPRLIRAFRAAFLLSLILAILGGLGATYEYHRYSARVDRRLARSPMFAAGARLRVGSQISRRGRSLPVADARENRSRYRVATDRQMPPQLVQAVVAIEDRRFFEHSGVNYVRTLECAVQDTVTLRMACGGSTLTQQLARTSFLSQRKTLSRKVTEILIARRLEERFSKQQIFAMYGQEINLGQNGPTPIKGFAQASRVYFGKDLNRLDLAQYALLAGMIQRPNFYNPYRHPERAIARRNLVLDAMVETRAITRAEADQAKAEPLSLSFLNAPQSLGGFEAAVLG